MKKKVLLKLVVIILGVMLSFGFCKSEAAEINSVFSNIVLTRSNISQLLTTTNSIVSNTENKILGIVDARQNGDYYQWNILTDGTGKVIWKVVKYESKESSPDYSDFMYCLNALRGFSNEVGEMHEAQDEYNIELSMTNAADKSNIILYAGGNLGNNYNKILWIADNTYIATGKDNYQSSEDYIALMNKAGIKIDTNEKINLTEIDIEAVEQMAIWYFTNDEYNAYTELPELYLNGKTMPSGGTDEYGERIDGRAEKIEQLYQYFITKAEENYTRSIPELNITDSKVTVEEDSNYFILGPYNLSGENTSLVNSIEVVSANKSYVLLDASKNVVSDNNFVKVIGSDFYLKIPKSEITSSTEIQLNLSYEYDIRDLIFTTNSNDYENTQPILIIKNNIEEEQIGIITPIEVKDVEVEKIWNDNNNQDGVRPEEIKVQLYENGVAKGSSVLLNATNSWKYTWNALLAGNSYTVKEINSSNVAVENNNNYDSNYIAQYEVVGNKTTITNTYETNEYFVKLLKVGEDGTTPLTGAWFKINEGQATLIPEVGQEIASGTISQTGSLELEYKLEEVTAPEGYIKLSESKIVKIKAEVALVNNEYEITNISLQEEIEGITVNEENNIITVKVENKPITGNYNLVIRKVDENGNILTGSKFEINGTEYDLTSGEITLLEQQQLLSTDDILFNYKIKETVVPNGYKKIEDTTISIRAKIESDQNNYKIIRTELIDNDGNVISNENIAVTLEGNTIVIAVKNKPVDKEFDLALRKFIIQINDEQYLREPVVDTSTISTKGTATYKHTKTPIVVQKGDIVTYTIRVYNEGELDGYVDKITDYLPDNLKPIIDGVEGIEAEKYEAEIEFNSNWLWIYSDNGKTVTTTITSKNNTETYSILTGKEEVIDTKLNAYVEGNEALDYIDVQIKCLVVNSAINGEYLTNIAEITESQDINGNQGDGFDSTLGNVDYSNLGDYKKQEAINSNENSYIAGQEDDDDFEKLFVKEFDLALRKFITKVNEASYSREPVVDTSNLGLNTITTAIYNHSKEPVIVETGDIVTYTIRIYNEGNLEGFANEITDDIPVGLEFLPDNSVNVSYRWRMLDSEGNETEDSSKAVMIVTDYLSNRNANNIIKAVEEVDGVKQLSYKDVEVQFRVIAKAEKLQNNVIINEAQISEDSERDIDSIPNRDEKYNYETGNNEDDIDYEPIKLQYFDLALKKFITKVNTTDYNNRYPEVIYEEDGSITYKTTKDPVLVTTEDIVVYTIRIYNEGEKSGTATAVTDNLPEGLEFLPDNEINKAYGWKLLNEQGNETDNLLEATKVTTDALKDEVIAGFVNKEGQKILSYKDVQIAFKVIEESTSDRILINTAEISEDNGDDVDSTPNNQVETEDDIDKEYVKVQYFDLSLKKWVTATKVTVDGKTTTTKTGFTEDSEGIAKVDIVASKLKKTTVKFVYNIKVTNEGELAGYATEIKDYIPNGFKFVEADNKDWKEIEDGIVVTEQLKDTLLNPGESATVEITLAWKNSATNLSLKTNYAEISEDSGNDKDSTPDNFNKEEDDIDDAQVILSIKTAGPTVYISLTLISVAILAAGIFLIKKYVIEK